jgi:hypothetical protein
LPERAGWWPCTGLTLERRVSANHSESLVFVQGLVADPEHDYVPKPPKLLRIAPPVFWVFDRDKCVVRPD